MKIKKVQYIQYDALQDFEIDFIPDYIIYGAGVASPELYTEKPVEVILSNFQGVQFLLEFARKNKIERLLYISSSEVYGKKITEEPFREDMYGKIDIDSIRSSYPIAKRASEMLCKAYYSEYGVDTVIARPGHIYGPSSKKTDKRIASDFAFKSAKGEKLVMKSSGLQRRSYCYSLDCAVQILIVLLKGKSGEAYNIGHDEVITIRKMSEIFAKAGKTELLMSKPSKAEKKAFNPMNNSSLNNDKALTEIIKYEGKTIIHIHIPVSAEVHSFKKEVYDRVDDADVKVTATAQLAMMYIRKQNRFTEKQIYPYISLEDFRLDLLPRIRKMATNNIEGVHSWESMSDEELLRSAGLYGKDRATGESGYNLAAVMLLGKDDLIMDICPAYETDALVRRVNVDRYDDREIIRTNLIESYDQLMEFGRKHLSDKFFIEGMERKNLRNIITREMIANTLIHREFTSSYTAKFVVNYLSHAVQ